MAANTTDRVDVVITRPDDTESKHSTTSRTFEQVLEAAQGYVQKNPELIVYVKGFGCAVYVYVSDPGQAVVVDYCEDEDDGFDLALER